MSVQPTRRTVSVGYQPDAWNETEKLWSQYPWMRAIWDQCMAETALQIRGPRLTQPGEVGYDGREGEGSTYLVPDKPSSWEYGAYYVLVRLGYPIFGHILPTLEPNHTLQQAYGSLVELMTGSPPKEAWKSTISFRSLKDKNDIEVCVSFGVQRTPTHTTVSIILVEVVRPEDRQFESIWARGVR